MTILAGNSQLRKRRKYRFEMVDCARRVLSFKGLLYRKSNRTCIRVKTDLNLQCRFYMFPIFITFAYCRRPASEDYRKFKFGFPGILQAGLHAGTLLPSINQVPKDQVSIFFIKIARNFQI